jgi:hypothetical protein
VRGSRGGRRQAEGIKQATHYTLNRA